MHVFCFLFLLWFQVHEYPKKKYKKCKRKVRMFQTDHLIGDEKKESQKQKQKSHQNDEQIGNDGGTGIQDFVSWVLTTLRLLQDERKEDEPELELESEREPKKCKESKLPEPLFDATASLPFDFVSEWVALQIQITFPLPSVLLALVVSFLNTNKPRVNQLEKLYQACKKNPKLFKSQFWKNFEFVPGSRFAIPITNRRNNTNLIEKLAFFAPSHYSRNPQMCDARINDSSSSSFLFGILFKEEDNCRTHPCLLSSSSPITLFSYWFGKKNKGLLVSKTWQKWCHSLFPTGPFSIFNNEVAADTQWNLVFPFRDSQSVTQTQMFHVWSNNSEDDGVKTKTKTKTKESTTTDWNFDWSIGFLHSRLRFANHLKFPPHYRLFQFQNLPFFQLVQLVVLPGQRTNVKEGWSVRFFLHPPLNYLETKHSTTIICQEEEEKKSALRQDQKLKPFSSLSSFRSLNELCSVVVDASTTELDERQAVTKAQPLATLEKATKKTKCNMGRPRPSAIGLKDVKNREKHQNQDNHTIPDPCPSKSLATTKPEEDHEKGTFFVWEDKFQMFPMWNMGETCSSGDDVTTQNQFLFESFVYLAPASLCVLRAEQKNQVFLRHNPGKTIPNEQAICSNGMFNAVRLSFRLLERCRKEPFDFPDFLEKNFFEITFLPFFGFPPLHQGREENKRDKREEEEEEKRETEPPQSTFSYLKTKERELKLLENCFSSANWEWETTRQAKESCKNLQKLAYQKITGVKPPLLLLIFFVFEILLSGSNLLDLDKERESDNIELATSHITMQKGVNDNKEDREYKYKYVMKDSKKVQEIAKNVAINMQEEGMLGVGEKRCCRWQPPSFLILKSMIPLFVACQMFPTRLLSLFLKNSPFDIYKYRFAQSKSSQDKVEERNNGIKTKKIIELFSTQLLSVFSNTFLLDHKSVECVYSPSKIESRLEFKWALGKNKVNLYLNPCCSSRLESYYFLRSGSMVGNFQLYPFCYLPSTSTMFDRNAQRWKKELLTFTEPRATDWQESEDQRSEWHVSSLFFYEFSNLVMNEEESREKEEVTFIWLPNLVFSHLFQYLTRCGSDLSGPATLTLSCPELELGHFFLNIRGTDYDLGYGSCVFKIMSYGFRYKNAYRAGLHQLTDSEKYKISRTKFSSSGLCPRFFNRDGSFDQERENGFHWVFQQNFIAFSQWLSKTKKQSNQKTQTLKKESASASAGDVDFGFSTFYEFKLIRCGSISNLKKFWNIDHRLSATSIFLYFEQLLNPLQINPQLVFIEHSFEVLHQWELLRVVLDLTPSEFGSFLFSPCLIDCDPSFALKMEKKRNQFHDSHDSLFDSSLIKRKSKYLVVSWLHLFAEEMEKQKTKQRESDKLFL